MEFAPNHKVVLESLSKEEAAVYREFLQHEWNRHDHETNNALAMVAEHETARGFWGSAAARHIDARLKCGDLIDTVTSRFELDRSA